MKLPQRSRNRYMYNWCLTAILSSLLIILSAATFAQDNTRVKGTVIDASTKEPLPFVNIAFVGKNIGTTTDFKGKYSIESKWASNKLSASFMGYETHIEQVALGQSQTIDIELRSNSIEVDEVTVVAQGRYRNKENPAVELIKNVLENRDRNRLQEVNHLSYDKYEKLQIDLNNITQEFMNQKILRKFEFMWSYVDTSEINGKPFLPLYLSEKKSKVYRSTHPKGENEIQYGFKTVGFEEFMDEQGTEYFMEKIYQDVDIYENMIQLMDRQFRSPISNIAVSVYKYFILDTVTIDNLPYVQLAFQPRNNADLAFRGRMYVSLDSSYAVKRIEMGLSPNANINFVSALEIEQEFTYLDKKGWHLKRDQLTIDYNFLNQKMGMYGKKTISYDDIKVDVPPPDSVETGLGSTFIIEADPLSDTEEFWEEQRHEELNDNEAGVYKMTKDLKELPAFKRAMNILFLIISGYYEVGKVDIGPMYSFISFNDVEGLRNRFSLRTNRKFSKKVAFESYVAYGWKDEKVNRRLKGGLGMSYFIKRRPYHQIDVEWQRDIRAPGASIRIATYDNVFVSFRRGIADLMLYFDSYRLKWTKEWKGVAIGADLEHMRNIPAGSLKFSPVDGSSELDEVNTSDITAWIRISPHVRFYESRVSRIPLRNRYPIIKFAYTYSIGNGFLGSDYNHHKMHASLFKRFYLNPVGFGDMNIEAGYISGQVPFPLLFVHKGNQTFFFDPGAYNMMNLFEFVSDRYVSLSYKHNFSGFFLNKVPLLKKLKWRTTLGFRGVYGQVAATNDPLLTMDSDRVFDFPSRTVYQTDDYQVYQTVTHTLKDKPYMEMSVGIENILKLLSVDLVKRLTYMDNPNISQLGALKGWGIRSRFLIRF